MSKKPLTSTTALTPNASFDIEVFRPGTFTAMGGQTLTYSDADLAAIADAYDADGSPAPVVVGHPVTDAPAFGWIESLRYDGEASRLIATVGNVAAEFAEALKERRYRKVSMALFPPDAPNNPKPGAWYAKHLGFLGAAAPAVSGLQPVALAGDPDEAVVFEFAEQGFRDTASLFRRMREFIIEQFGLEKADEVLPGWEIEWLDDRGHEKPSHFSEQQTQEPVMTGKPTITPAPNAPTTPPVSEPDVAFAEREADLARRQADLDEREAKARTAEHVAFCDGLIKEGRLLPADKAERVAMLDTLAASDAQVAFAGNDGEVTKSPLDLYKAQMAVAPKIVPFGKIETGDLPASGEMTGEQIAFAAKTYQREQEEAGITISISDAVYHVTKGEDQ